MYNSIHPVLNSPSDKRAKIKRGQNFPCIQYLHMVAAGELCCLSDNSGSSNPPTIPTFSYKSEEKSLCVLIKWSKFEIYITANWLEARTIKYTNFPAKYMNSRSKLHRNIHVVLCQVGVTWNNRWGIGILELRDHAECHSTFNSSPKWILLIIYFYDIFFGIFPH